MEDEKLKYIIDNISDLNKQAMDAVSYTHLDVYKRQR